MQHASTVRVEHINCQEPTTANIDIRSRDTNALRDHCEKLKQRIEVLKKVRKLGAS